MENYENNGVVKTEEMIEDVEDVETEVGAEDAENADMTPEEKKGKKGGLIAFISGISLVFIGGVWLVIDIARHGGVKNWRQYRKDKRRARKLQKALNKNREDRAKAMKILADDGAFDVIDGKVVWTADDEKSSSYEKILNGEKEA